MRRSSVGVRSAVLAAAQLFSKADATCCRWQPRDLPPRRLVVDDEGVEWRHRGRALEGHGVAVPRRLTMLVCVFTLECPAVGDDLAMMEFAGWRSDVSLLGDRVEVNAAARESVAVRYYLPWPTLSLRTA